MVFGSKTIQSQHTFFFYFAYLFLCLSKAYLVSFSDLYDFSHLLTGGMYVYMSTYELFTVASSLTKAPLA